MSEENSDLQFRFETRVPDILKATEVIDYFSTARNRKSFHILGVGLLLVMFVPEVFKHPEMFLYWVMLILTLLLALLVWKGNTIANMRFAKKRVESAPEITVTMENGQLLAQSDAGDSFFPFDSTLRVYDYKNVLAFEADGNRILAIPKDQLDSKTVSHLETRLQGLLQDRYKKIESLGKERIKR